MSRTLDEQLEALSQKEAQLKARKRQLQSRANAQARKERTRRLIKIGATLESVLGKELSPEDVADIGAFIKDQEDRGKFFTRFRENSSGIKYIIKYLTDRGWKLNIINDTNRLKQLHKKGKGM